MEDVKRNDFVGRHLIVDASTYSRRNLTSTDTAFALFEALARNLDMTLVLPPIVCRYPFANDEISSFCDEIELELQAKAKELAEGNDKPIDLSLTPVRIMREFLRRRQMQESGVTGVSVWAESHAAIHTWDEDNYYAFDAFSCKDFRLKDALRLLLTPSTPKSSTASTSSASSAPRPACPTSRSTITGKSSRTAGRSASSRRSTSTS